MNNTHRGSSELIAAVFLIGMVAIGASIFYLGLNGVSYENFRCEIQELYVYEIDTDSYWGTLKILNNGDYAFDNYNLILYGDAGVISMTNNTTIKITPEKSIDIEFEIVGSLDENVIIGVEIKTDNQSSICDRSVEV